MRMERTDAGREVCAKPALQNMRFLEKAVQSKAKQSKARQSKARQSKAKQSKKDSLLHMGVFLYKRNVQMPHGYAGAHPSEVQCTLWSLEIRSYSLGSMLFIIATSSSSLMGVDFPFAYSASTRSFIAATKGLCFAMASSPRSLK